MKAKSLIALVASAFALAPLPAAAQDYPNRPVTLIVPFSPGGPGDIAGRFIAQQLQAALGSPFVVENRPGANGVLAATLAAKAPADGYTLMQISSSHTANESLIPKRGYVLMRDFEPVASINYTEMVLMARNDLPVKSVRDLIDYSKANPGKVNYASSGNGSGYHLAAELFKSMGGANMTHVPYKGASTARTDLVGGHVDVMFDALNAGLELVRSGKVKGLATTAKARSSVLPDVQTVAETVPGYESTIFIGLMAPKGTPAAVVDKLHATINRILAMPESKEFFAKQGAQAFVSTRAEYTKFLNDDIAQLDKVVRISGAKVD